MWIKVLFVWNAIAEPHNPSAVFTTSPHPLLFFLDLKTECNGLECFICANPIRHISLSFKKREKKTTDWTEISRRCQHLFQNVNQSYQQGPWFRIVSFKQDPACAPFLLLPSYFICSIVLWLLTLIFPVAVACFSLSVPAPNFFKYLWGVHIL